MKKYLFLFVAPLFFLSCGPNYILDQKIDIENQQWTYADSLSFSVDISDDAQMYNLYLDVEHSTEYSFQNMYIQFHTISPDGKRATERVSVNFMNKILQCLCFVFSPVMVSVDCVAVNLWYNEQFDD